MKTIQTGGNEMSERIQYLSEIKIDERYTFDDGDEERMGEISNVCTYHTKGFI